MTAADELKAFQVDPRFEVTLFAGEEEFPDIACPIQMRWDSQGRMWVSCSTTYPHVYPGNEPNDKLVILEDTDGDGKADKSSVFADNLNIPLSFEFGDGGVYVPMSRTSRSSRIPMAMARRTFARWFSPDLAAKTRTTRCTTLLGVRTAI